jgi:hypothetical protein
VQPERQVPVKSLGLAAAVAGVQVSLQVLDEGIEFSALVAGRLRKAVLLGLLSLLFDQAAVFGFARWFVSQAKP